MSKKYDLRVQRANTIINKTSKRQEKVLDKSLVDIVLNLQKSFPGIVLEHESQIYLKDIVEYLRLNYPSIDFYYFFDSSSMRPDGGILYIKAKNGERYPILISEKKNQGTNDLRALEGKKKQAKGNAIERLGKNVIGLKTALKKESIFPFVCFGDGCDFAEDSSILDRVVTIAEFGKLNVIHLHNQGGEGEFCRGSFFFKVEEWKKEEMSKIGYEIAKGSVYYYYSKYGEESFNLMSEA